MDNVVGSSQRAVLRSFIAFILIASLFCTGLPAVLAADKDPAGRVYFQNVADKARELSKTSYQEPGRDLPDVLKKMGYDQWRGIRFKSSQSLWVKDPFSVQFFHPGFLYQHPVTIHYVDREGTHPFPFSSEYFDYDTKGLKGQLPQDHGFAGLRIHYPLNTKAYADELVAFLGASYFRALGKDLAYGLSARGLAVDTAEDTGEEFSLFREFWIVRPVPAAKSITLYALLDSQSLTGGYEFVVTPGEETQMKVSCVLFLRQHVRKLGIAPLTSMFAHGENSGFTGSADFRPEVHDSDGLQIHARSGEWLWHPLVNPPRLLINAFGGGQPEGFGLMQRDIDFDHYQDLEARYDRRPSVWVVPQGDWGSGHLELVQLPTESEYNDNIVAYWVPEKAIEPGNPVKFNYSLFWHSARHARSLLGFVSATRIVKEAQGAMFLVDFAGGDFGSATAAGMLTADIWASEGAKITGTQLVRNTITGGWRLVLRIRLEDASFMQGLLPNQKPAIEFRAFLKDGPKTVTETWSYTYLP